MNISVTRVLKLSLLLLSLLVSGCKSLMPSDGMSGMTSIALMPGYSQSVNAYLQQQQPLNAVGALLQQGQFARAQQLLHHSHPVQPEQQQLKALLQAQLAMQTHQPKRALKALIPMETAALPAPWQPWYLSNVAWGQAASGEIHAAIKTRLQLALLLQGSVNGIKNQRTVWRLLNQANISQLRRWQADADNSIDQGWYQLALLNKQYAQDDNAFYAAISAWRNDHAEHPANRLMASPINTDVAVSHSRLALLLPLSGAYQRQGQAVKRGILNAYYASPTELRPTLKIYDSHSAPIKQLYQQALREGADTVIGPLTRSNTFKLSELRNIPVRTLLLNDAQAQQTNLFELSLSTRDQALSLANKIYNDGHRHVLVILPNNKWGQSIESEFKTQFNQYGATINSVISLSPEQSMRDAVQQHLGLFYSKQRYNALKQTLRQPIKFIPRRRQDIDAILLIANADTARQIKPLLNFYYAKSIPIYAPSMIYQGPGLALKNRDLDGIIFPDLPWMFGDSQLQRYATLNRLYAKDFKNNARLYALGIDAFNLNQHWQRLIAFPKFYINGAMGPLWLSGHKVMHGLQWAQFQQGRPKVQT